MSHFSQAPDKSALLFSQALGKMHLTFLKPSDQAMLFSQALISKLSTATSSSVELNQVVCRRKGGNLSVLHSFPDVTEACVRPAPSSYRSGTIRACARGLEIADVLQNTILVVTVQVQPRSEMSSAFAPTCPVREGPSCLSANSFLFVITISLISLCSCRCNCSTPWSTDLWVSSLTA